MAGQGPSANVRDVTTLEKAQWALVAYREEIQQGLIEAQAEVARFTNWLEQQRPQELAAQMQRTKRELENAKADLTRAEMMQSNMGTSADTERKRVQRAKKENRRPASSARSTQKMEPSTAAGAIFVHCGNQSTGLSSGFHLPIAGSRSQKSP